MISSFRVKKRCWPAFRSLGPRTPGHLLPLWLKSTASRTSWWRSTTLNCTCTSTGWRSPRKSMACQYPPPIARCARCFSRRSVRKYSYPSLLSVPQPVGTSAVRPWVSAPGPAGGVGRPVCRQHHSGPGGLHLRGHAALHPRRSYAPFV